MPSVDVVDLKRQKVGTASLPDTVFGREPRPTLVHEAVVMQAASQRQGTASTLNRGEVSGSGKKPWKQKHTGRARSGSVRSPIWRHGGTVFGPRPRKYGFTITKKKYRAAMQSVLSSRMAEGRVIVVSDLSIAEAKTKLLAKALSSLGIEGRAVLIAGEGRSELIQAAQNLPDVTLLKPEELNVYDLIRCQSIVIPEGEVARLKEAWS